MKSYLPYNILLALTVAVTGFAVLYNFMLRERSATTLQYSYPIVEQSRGSETVEFEPESFSPQEPEEEEDGGFEAVSGEEPDEEPILTRVQFPLDINTATAEQLKFIPQVGEVMSRRIVQYREVLGGYTDLEQLRNIKGVGDATYKHLYTYLIISEDTEPDSDDQSEPPDGAEELFDDG